MRSIGFSYQLHDAAAAAAVDGEVVFAVAEERLSRRKHDGAFPKRAIAACLEALGCPAHDLDAVRVGWSPAVRTLRHDVLTWVTGRQQPSRHAVVSALRDFRRHTLERQGLHIAARRFGVPRARLGYVDHHRAHALSAWVPSGFAEATVVVFDGRGAFESTTVWHAQGGRLELVRLLPWPNSLGLFYAAFTHYLGFRMYSDEWKVMGLAPYGEPGVDLSPWIELTEDGYRVASRSLLGRYPGDVTALEARLGPARSPDSDPTDRHRNVAHAVQAACESAMAAVVRDAVGRTGCRDVCLAGGVALNSKANGRMLADGVFDRVWIQPASGDDGAAYGAALAPHVADGVVSRRRPHTYLGPELDAKEADVRTACAPYGLTPKPLADPAATAAELLAAGKIVGWVQGCSEFGPRALGHRSILADPRDDATKDRVNALVKFREPWRPFAPAVLAERAGEYFLGAAEHDSPYMVLTYAVRPEKRAQLAAVTHIDGSARVQTVTADAAPQFYRLIEQFGARTGVPVVLNTSFNLRGEPIVQSAAEAVSTYVRSGLDAVIVGTCLIDEAAR